MSGDSRRQLSGKRRQFSGCRFLFSGKRRQFPDIRRRFFAKLVCDMAPDGKLATCTKSGMRPKPCCVCTTCNHTGWMRQLPALEGVPEVGNEPRMSTEKHGWKSFCPCFIRVRPWLK